MFEVIGVRNFFSALPSTGKCSFVTDTIMNYYYKEKWKRMSVYVKPILQMSQ